MAGKKSVKQKGSKRKYKVERIVEKAIRNGEVFYFLKWENYPETDNTWEPKQNVLCPAMIEEFEYQLSQQEAESVPGPSSVVDIKKEPASPEAQGKKKNNDKKKPSSLPSDASKEIKTSPYGRSTHARNVRGTGKTTIDDETRSPATTMSTVSKKRRLNVAENRIVEGKTPAKKSKRTEENQRSRTNSSLSDNEQSHSDEEELPPSPRKSKKSKAKTTSATSSAVVHHTGRKLRQTRGQSQEAADTSSGEEGGADEGIKILGITDDPNRMFHVQLPGPDKIVQLIPVKQANVKWPEQVIKFYEERLVFTSKVVINEKSRR